MLTMPDQPDVDWAHSGAKCLEKPEISRKELEFTGKTEIDILIDILKTSNSLKINKVFYKINLKKIFFIYRILIYCTCWAVLDRELFGILNIGSKLHEFIILNILIMHIIIFRYKDNLDIKLKSYFLYCKSGSYRYCFVLMWVFSKTICIEMMERH